MMNLLPPIDSMTLYGAFYFTALVLAATLWPRLYRLHNSLLVFGLVQVGLLAMIIVTGVLRVPLALRIVLGIQLIGITLVCDAKRDRRESYSLWPVVGICLGLLTYIYIFRASLSKSARVVATLESLDRNRLIFRNLSWFKSTPVNFEYLSDLDPLQKMGIMHGAIWPLVFLSILALVISLVYRKSGPIKRERWASKLIRMMLLMFLTLETLGGLLAWMGLVPSAFFIVPLLEGGTIFNQTLVCASLLTQPIEITTGGKK